MWLVHKGGFTSAKLQPGGATGADGSINIKLDSGEILTVDEEDVEKVSECIGLSLSLYPPCYEYIYIYATIFDFCMY